MLTPFLVLLDFVFLSGVAGSGQEQLSLAILHAYEGCSVVVVDLASQYLPKPPNMAVHAHTLHCIDTASTLMLSLSLSLSVCPQSWLLLMVQGVSLGGGSSVPQALEAKVAAARRATPCILYLPSLHRWWSDEDLKDHGPALLDALKGLRTANILVLASAVGDVPTSFQEVLVPVASIWTGQRQLPASDLERSVALAGLCRLPSPSPERIHRFVQGLNDLKAIAPPPRLLRRGSFFIFPNSDV